MDMDIQEAIRKILEACDGLDRYRTDLEARGEPIPEKTQAAVVGAVALSARFAAGMGTTPAQLVEIHDVVLSSVRAIIESYTAYGLDGLARPLSEALAVIDELVFDTVRDNLLQIMRTVINQHRDCYDLASSLQSFEGRASRSAANAAKGVCHALEDVYGGNSRQFACNAEIILGDADVVRRYFAEQAIQKARFAQELAAWPDIPETESLREQAAAAVACKLEAAVRTAIDTLALIAAHQKPRGR